MAKQYLASGAVEEAMDYLQQILADPHCPKRTKVQAAKTLVANAAKISSKKTQLQLDGAVTSLSMSDLLALAGSAGSDSQLSQPGVKGELPASTGPASGAGSSPALGSGEDHQEGKSGGSAYLTGSLGDSLEEADRLISEPTEGHGRALGTETPEQTPSTNKRKEDPTEGLGDTASSEDTLELDR